MTDMIAAVDFSALETAVAAIGLTIIGIAVALKGISLVKRVVGKA